MKDCMPSIDPSARLRLVLLVAAALILAKPEGVSAQATIVDIAVSAGVAGTADSEPSIAVNPANPSQIAVVSFSGNWLTNPAPVWWSNDGGNNWIQLLQIPQPAIPPGAPPAVAQVAGPGDQKIAFNAAGNIFIAELGVGINAFGNRLALWNFVYRQTGPFGANLTPGIAYGDDQPQLDVDVTAASPCSGQLYSPWLNFTPANRRSMVSNSATGGVAMANVGAGNNTTFSNRTTRSAVAPDGKVYIIYKTREGAVDTRFENAHFRVNRSDDCGATWTGVGGAAGIPVHGAGSVQTWFTQTGRRCVPANGFGNAAKGNVGRARSSDAWIAVDPGDGDVYAAYVRKDASGFAQIYVARSTSQGALWTSTRVTDGNNHSGYPEIAVASNGTVGVLYIDYDDSGPNTIFRHRFARSFNDGATWSDQILQAMNPNVLINGTNCFLWGDYEGLTASGNVFYGVFTGRSIGRPTPQLDPIFFRETAVNFRITICAFNPWLCRPPVRLDPGLVVLACPFIGCIVIDPIPRNCLVKFDCPGCPPNALCPPYYTFFIEGLDEVWKVGLFDAQGNPAPYFQYKTDNGVVISFRPSEENYIDGQVGNYFFAFEMGPNGKPEVEYTVQMRLEQSDRPFSPEKLRDARQ